MPRLIELDGRTLEGGGQLLRISTCLSALTGTPIHIDNIRGNRSGGGGLKRQHLTCVEWLAHACSAEVDGAQLKSASLTFRPGISKSESSHAYKKSNLPGGRIMYECFVQIGSAGSTALALQAVLPYILFAPPAVDTSSTTAFVRLHMSGGTNVSNSPSFEYITKVLLPTLEVIGLPAITSHLKKRGWSTGPPSPGSFFLDIPLRTPRDLPAFSVTPLDRQQEPEKPCSLDVTFLGPSACHNQLRMMMAATLQRYFGERYTESDDTLTISCEESGHPSRLYLIGVATIESFPLGEPRPYRLGADWLYNRKIRKIDHSVTEMVEKVSKDLHDEWASGAWVDEHMRDQLVIFSALASGRCKVWEGLDKEHKPRQPSLHARTAEWVVERMLMKSGDEAEILSDLTALSLEDQAASP